MKKSATQNFVMLLFLLAGIAATAQNKYVSKVDYYFEYPNIVISYNLQDNDKTRKFTVSATAETNKGRTFELKNARGAIGKGQLPGTGKQIIWNIARDIESLETGEKFAFTVTAVPEETTPEQEKPPVDSQNEPDKAQPETEQDAPQSQKADKQESPSGQKAPEDKQKDGKDQEEQAPDYKQQTLSRTEVLNKLEAYDPPSTLGSMFLSTLWPGWGASRYKENSNAGWWGLLGWGAAGGYFYLHARAESLYNDYLESIMPGERQDYYDQAVKANDNSMKFVYAAGAVWGIEYLRVLIRAIKANKTYNTKKREFQEKFPEMDIAYFYNPVMEYTTIGLRIHL